jgi:hypothetical protein
MSRACSSFGPVRQENFSISGARGAFAALRGFADAAAVAAPANAIKHTMTAVSRILVIIVAGL